MAQDLPAFSGPSISTNGHGTAPVGLRVASLGGLVLDPALVMIYPSGCIPVVGCPGRTSPGVGVPLTSVGAGGRPASQPRLVDHPAVALVEWDAEALVDQPVPLD